MNELQLFELDVLLRGSGGVVAEAGAIVGAGAVVEVGKVEAKACGGTCWTEAAPDVVVGAELMFPFPELFEAELEAGRALEGAATFWVPRASVGLEGCKFTRVIELMTPFLI